MASAATIKPDIKRIERDIENLAKIGKAGPTGVCRLSWTPEDIAAREHVMGLFRDAGLKVTVDAVGNIVGRFERCADPALPAVVSGSHIDTPILGGKYDGTIGVIGPLEAVRCLNDAKIKTRHPVEVVVFPGEELTRFGASFKGSVAVVGLMTEDQLKREWVDTDGVSYWDALVKAGLKPAEFKSCRRDPKTIKCYLEMHIEQGRVLEDAGKRVGVVSAITGATRGWCTIYGTADHSGATPMNMRNDALCAAAEIILAMEEYAREEGHLSTVGTVGYLKVEPGAANVVPGKVTMSLENRGVNLPSKQRAMKRLAAKIDEVRKRRGLRIDVDKPLEDESPYPLPESMVKFLSQQCEKVGAPYMVMPSGAGHDAQQFTHMTEVGMLFVPSVGGFSHCPEELTRMEDIALGTQVLGEAILEQAGRA